MREIARLPNPSSELNLKGVGGGGRGGGCITHDHAEEGREGGVLIRVLP